MILIWIIRNLMLLTIMRIVQLCSSTSFTKKQLGFIGLGTMGKHMAGHLAGLTEQQSTLLVYNRNTEKAVQHTQAYGSRYSDNLSDIARQCDVIFLSLPTSIESKLIIETLGPSLKPGATIIDTTSGEPKATVALHSYLQTFGVELVDCPVSGGPAGAEGGTLTCMLGGNLKICDEMKPILDLSFSKKSVYCGPIGSGMHECDV
jgi:3-hydroxyisobutyrate dehydrogenase